MDWQQCWSTWESMVSNAGGVRKLICAEHLGEKRCGTDREGGSGPPILRLAEAQTGCGGLARSKGEAAA
eukprot:2938176-Rhodomonas_salina.1